jgi:hypothetical protein
MTEHWVHYAVFVIGFVCGLASALGTIAILWILAAAREERARAQQRREEAARALAEDAEPVLTKRVFAPVSAVSQIPRLLVYRSDHGASVFCHENRHRYEYDANSSAAVNGTTVLPSFSGPGRWIGAIPQNPFSAHSTMLTGSKAP